jgi:hypothetical protein
MTDIVSMNSRPPKKMSRQEFKQCIVKLVEAGALKISLHLNRDHPERRISPSQIEMCLLKGTVQDDPYLNKYGNWQGEVYRHMAGQELTVVAALEWEQQVIVVTAYKP